jgi:4-amino-4-deoxy-L-arabinose transferase-like glycosyltransferase
MNRWPRAAMFVLLLTAAAVLYARHLGDAPIYLSPDEAIIAVDAHSLATTGRDVHGAFMPLYFQIQMRGETRSGWFMPVIFYAIALVLKVLPLSEASVRLPSVIVGLTDIILMFFVARRIFKSTTVAVVSAAMLALTPAHFILSRYALDYLYPLPFLLGWLLCVISYLENGRLRTLFVGTVLLGIGFYSYIAAVLMAPVYLLFTAAVLFHQRKPARDYGVAFAGFALPLLLVVPWFVAHPTALSDTAQRYELYNTGSMNALQALRSFVSYNNIEARAATYWSFLNPSFLFFTGDAQMPFSTRSVGVFLLPMLALIVAGICVAIRRPAPAALLALFGFFAAPLAAVLVPENSAIIRAAGLMPFGVLLATFGLETLWHWPLVRRARVALLPLGLVVFLAGLAYALWRFASHGQPGGSAVPLIGAGIVLCLVAFASDVISLPRIVAVFLLLAMPLLFSGFYRDYFGDYRRRSSNWLGGNLRGALVDLIDLQASDGASYVYFAQLRSTSGMADTRNRWMPTYWTFYVTKLGRRDLLQKWRTFDPDRVAAMPPRSLVLANIGDPTVDTLVREGALRRVKVITDQDGTRFYTILQR